MSPVSVITHLLAIAAGVWGGFWVIGRVTPDLPQAGVEPGVEATGDVEGGDHDSLLRTGPFAIALAQLSDQLAAEDAITSLHLEPGSLDAQGGSGGLGLEPEDVPPNAPQRIVAAIRAQRPQVTLDDVAFMRLRPSADGPQWYVQLDLDIDPPRTYVTPLDGSTATAGG